MPLLHRLVLCAALAAGLTAPTRAAEPDKLLPATTDSVVQVNIRQVLDSDIAKKYALEQLKQGARVRVHKESRDGKTVAQSIQVVGIQWGDLITQLRGYLNMADMAMKLLK